MNKQTEYIRKIKRFEHYHRLFAETKTAFYYVNSKGFIEKYLRANITPHGTSSKYFERVPAFLYCKTKGVDEPVLCSYVGGKRVIIKNLVAKTFCRYWKDGMKITHIDEDPSNCNYVNLNISAPNIPSYLLKHTYAIEAIVDGHKRRFSSTKDAADALGISQTHIRYILTGRVKRPGIKSGETLEIKFVKHE